jgi:hypothetical protein
MDAMLVEKSTKRTDPHNTGISTYPTSQMPPHRTATHRPQRHGIHSPLPTHTTITNTNQKGTDNNHIIPGT